ncbi:Endonuclease III [hydrothermal vent metagenome]|uniref:Endonuclease III n=1 Tax=hydrothermal vent metagenome TaxID=652676 RepID=A0A3B1CEE8_9ZZZZ
MTKININEAKKRSSAIHKVLKKLYPKPKVSLDYSNPLQLLVATILSAQCTDERVNKVTKSLFAKYRSADDYQNAPLDALEEDIRSTGFYRNKAKSIRKCCADLVLKYGGEVPGSLEELTALAGVGRKTANVVLGAAFGVPGVVVDTHVKRVSGRLGLTVEKNPEKIEKDLMALIPQKEWTLFSNRLVLFGRKICAAKKPACGSCPLFKLCPWERKTDFAEKGQSWKV